MSEGQQLLAEYVRTGSESAFRDLVTRYIDFVHSTALRLVNGDSHLAEDVTQMVFADLARAARILPSGTALGGWLHRHTCFVAAKTMRGERRRKSRERHAAEMNALHDQPGADLKWIAPVLDEAINRLGEKDRMAVLLRYFEQRDFRAVGEALGSNEEAARKRVNRALEKLQLRLKRNGIVLSAAALGSVLISDAVHAAPAGLAASVSGAAWAHAAIGSGTSLTLIKLMTMTHLKTAMIGAVAVAAAAAAPLAIQQHAQSRLRDENRSLRQDVAQLTQVAAENQRLTQQLAAVKASTENDSAAELLRLRNEVTRLRNDSQELARLKAAAQSGDRIGNAESDLIALLKRKLEEMPDKKIPEFQFLTDRDWLMTVQFNRRLDTDDDYRRAFSFLRQVAKKEFVPMLGRALHSYARANQGQLPTDLTQLKPYFAVPVDDAVFPRYELKETGKLSDVPVAGTYPPSAPPEVVRTNARSDLPWTKPVVVEKAPVDEKYDYLFTATVYGYSYRSVGEIKGSGAGTWAKVNPDGEPEVIFPANADSTTVIRGGSFSGGSGSGGSFGGSSVGFEQSQQIRFKADGNSSTNVQKVIGNGDPQ